MIKKIKNILMAITLLFSLNTPVLLMASSTTYAATPKKEDQTRQGCNNISSNIADGASDASGGSVDCSESSLSQGSLGKTAKKIVDLFSVIVGIVAIIMIIYAGFRYITSGGDSSRVGSAKNTLIYAVIGLIVVALAQVIVHFTLHESNQLTDTTSQTEP